MYGMIHRALRQMVLEERGAEVWSAIERSANAEPSDFISSATYPDELTQRLLSTSSEALGQDPDHMLAQFGQFWIRYAEAGSFAAILTFTGQDIVSFIANLDRMHRTIEDVMPNARMPSFSILAHDVGQITVQYRSTRIGLAPFVSGLLYGLLDRFNLVGSVRIISEDNDKSLFLIEYR
jgi:hypothetical protein